MQAVVTYLHHSDHSLIGHRVCADTEVPGGVPTYDPVDGIPVGGVGLVSVQHREVGHYCLYTVFRDLSCKLQSIRKNVTTSYGAWGARLPANTDKRQGLCSLWMP